MSGMHPRKPLKMPGGKERPSQMLAPVAPGPDAEIMKDPDKVLEYFQAHPDQAIAWNLACVAQRLAGLGQMLEHFLNKNNEPVAKMVLDPKKLRADGQ